MDDSGGIRNLKVADSEAQQAQTQACLNEDQVSAYYIKTRSRQCKWYDKIMRQWSQFLKSKHVTVLGLLACYIL